MQKDRSHRPRLTRACLIDKGKRLSPIWSQKPRSMDTGCALGEIEVRLNMIRSSRIRTISSILVATASVLGFVLHAEESSNPPPELTLAQAIQIAIEHNISLTIAKLDVTKSQWQVAEAKTRRFPESSIDLFAAGNLTSPTFSYKKGVFGTLNGLPNPSTDVSINLSSGVTGYITASVAQPITQLYKIHLIIREQELSVDFATQKSREKEQSIVANVKQGYYAILQTESALDAQQALVKQYNETDRVVSQYIAQQSLLLSESLDVKAKLAQAEHQIVVLNDDLDTQKEHLNDLLSRDLDTPFRVQSTPPVTSEQLDLKLARQTALRQRPEVKEAEIDVSKADYDRKLAKAQYIPDVGAAVRYFSPINTEILPQNIASAGLALTWDPFDWGRRRDLVKQKDITEQQTSYQLQDVRSKVILDVDKTFRKLQESRSLLAVAKAARDASNEKLREVNDQFNQSAVLLRDVLQQQAAVANANHEYEESLLSLLNATAEFEKALGED